MIQIKQIAKMYVKKCENIVKKLIEFYLFFTMKERIYHYASSLSFYNIFSIVPIFLMIFSILSNFSGFQTQLKSLQSLIIINFIPKNTEVITSFMDTFLQNSKTMGIIGFIASLFSTFIFFRSYEDISSHIFHGKKRNIFDSFIIYWILITLVPTIVAVSFYFVVNFVKDSKLDLVAHSITPFFAVWILFALLFRISANRAINIFSLLLSSFGGAILWHITKHLFLYYMVYNKFYSTIYGSVSIIMFLLLWIYISWIIFLITMRVCYMLDVRLDKDSS